VGCSLLWKSFWKVGFTFVFDALILSVTSLLMLSSILLVWPSESCAHECIGLHC
jgi:hypothetical protein